MVRARSVNDDEKDDDMTTDFISKINEPLVRVVMERIKENLDGWDQETYVGSNGCGTTYCFAGHALVSQGYTVDGRNFYSPAPYRTLIYGVAQEAMAELGFTVEQATAVFMWFPYYLMPETTQEERYTAFADRVEEYTGIRV